MAPSQFFFDLVEHFEGLKLQAYQDQAGIWTIGYGTTHYPDGTPVKDGDTCTQEEAQQYLLAHINGIILGAQLTQPQFDACLSFAYNAGIGAWNTSSLKKAILSGAGADEINDDFCKWDKAHIDGQLVEVPGLLRRRKCEAYLFNNGCNATGFVVPASA